MKYPFIFQLVQSKRCTCWTKGKWYIFKNNLQNDKKTYPLYISLFDNPSKDNKNAFTDLQEAFS